MQIKSNTKNVEAHVKNLSIEHVDLNIKKDETSEYQSKGVIDKTIEEVISSNNKLYEIMLNYTKNISKIAQNIKEFDESVRFK